MRWVCIMLMWAVVGCCSTAAPVRNEQLILNVPEELMRVPEELRELDTDKMGSKEPLAADTVIIP